MFRLQVPGGSADRCGKIMANDVIVSVDGSAVRARSLQVLRDLILGAPGSNISLSFLRGPNPQDPSSTAHNFPVQLMRGSPQYLASLSGPGTNCAPQQGSAPSIKQPTVSQNSVQVPDLIPSMLSMGYKKSHVDAAIAAGYRDMDSCMDYIAKHFRDASPPRGMAAGGGGAAATTAAAASCSRSFASSSFKPLYTDTSAPQSHARLFTALEDFLAAYCKHYGCDPVSGAPRSLSRALSTPLTPSSRQAHPCSTAYPSTPCSAQARSCSTSALLLSVCGRRRRSWRTCRLSTTPSCAV